MIFDELPGPLRRSLLESEQELVAPAGRRIFTNRDLAMDKLEVIGFDMDYTLAPYLQDALEEVSIQCTLDKLIARGYPEVLREAHCDPAFAIRGLMVDRVEGNVLKLDRHGYVGRAYHGTRRMNRTQRKGLYRDQRLGQERERFAEVDTLFALPEVTLFAAVVDRIDDHPEDFGDTVPSYSEAWADVRACIDESHRDGSLKAQIKANPGKYIEDDPDLPAALHKLRSAGKKLFLLTNSFYPYSDVVMRHLLHDKMSSYPDWQSYFDWTVVGAMKPRFFTDAEPFLELDREGKQVGSPKSAPQRGKIYQGGNQLGMQKALGVHADEVLYVGDHIYGDIVKSKKSSGWRTALIVSELETELAVRARRAFMRQEIDALYDLRAALNQELASQRHLMRALSRMKPEEVEPHGLTRDAADAMIASQRADAKTRFERLRQYADETAETLTRRGRELDEAFNPYWGSLFAERHDTSRFGAQVEAYACIYTSRVSNLRYVSPARYFHSPRGSMPHW